MSHPADLPLDGAEGYAPPGGRVLVGPFLTESQLARRLGQKTTKIRSDPWLLRISGKLALEPVYPEFQIDGCELRLDVAFVALLLKRRVSDLEACDWLARPTAALEGSSPLQWLQDDGSLRSVVEALPEPTRRLPDAAPRADLSELRRAWLDFRNKGTTPGWTIAWERIAQRTRRAHPMPI